MKGDGPRQPKKRGGPRGDAGFLLACAALYIGLLVLYWPSLSFAPLRLDDQRQLAHVASADWQPLAPDPFGHVRPLKQLLFRGFAAADGALGPWRAAVLAGLLLCVALVQRLAAAVSGSRALGLATAVAFAINPTLSSVVCWLSAVNVLLCALLVLLYIELGARAAASGTRAPLVLACALLALALLASEVALLAPVALWLRLRAAPPIAPAASLKPLWLGSALCALGFLALRLAAHEAAPLYRAAAAPAWLLAASSLRYALENAALWLWPFTTSGVLLVDAPAEKLLASALCAVLVIAAGALVYRMRARARVIAFGLAFCALFLLPYCNLIPLGNSPVALHYLCLPSIGLALALCGAIARGLARMPAKARPAAHAVLVALALAFIPETRALIAAFGDERLLYARTIANHPDNVEALVNLGSVELSRGELARAEPPLERARALAPHAEGVVRNGFVLRMQQRRPDAALALLEAQPGLDDDTGMQRGKGEALQRLGRPVEAIAAFERAFAIAGDRDQRFEAGYQLLGALLSQGELDRARALFARLWVEYPDREELAPARALLGPQG